MPLLHVLTLWYFGSNCELEMQRPWQKHAILEEISLMPSQNTLSFLLSLSISLPPLSPAPIIFALTHTYILYYDFKQMNIYICKVLCPGFPLGRLL